MAASQQRTRLVRVMKHLLEPLAEPTGDRSVSLTRHERVGNSRSVPPTGCLQGGAAAPRKILAGGSLEAVVCHAGSQAAGMASAAYPTNSATAERLRLVPRATTRGEVSISFT